MANDIIYLVLSVWILGILIFLGYCIYVWITTDIKPQTNFKGKFIYYAGQLFAIVSIIALALFLAGTFLLGFRNLWG